MKTLCLRLQMYDRVWSGCTGLNIEYTTLTTLLAISLVGLIQGNSLILKQYLKSWPLVAQPWPICSSMSYQDLSFLVMFNYPYGQQQWKNMRSNSSDLRKLCFSVPGSCQRTRRILIFIPLLVFDLSFDPLTGPKYPSSMSLCLNMAFSSMLPFPQSVIIANQSLVVFPFVMIPL